VKRRAGIWAALAAAVMAGAIGAVALGAGTRSPAAAPPPRISTATVTRTSLATSVLTGGTLGYAPAPPLINQVTGTYTSLPAPGLIVRAGQVLYRVDDQPVVLMTGRLPAWRPFSPGMTAGRDVSELQANLIALGYAQGLLSARTGVFDTATAEAVQRWQYAAGIPVTGQIPLGQVVFMPEAVRVGSHSVAPGQPAVPGAHPYLVTTLRRSVTVPLNPTQPPIAVGQHVMIVLPTQARTPGTVTAIGSAPTGSGHGSSASSGTATVTPDKPAATGTQTLVPVQVSLTVQSVRNVLAVPVTALLALQGGGYGLEIVTASGRHRLIGVTTGVFAGGLVQVSGAGLAAGTRVVVTQ
jgi:peptidoglycan hydrolase-like protein with peptidoglycan-binding domain